jgi:hypothetical protein
MASSDLAGRKHVLQVTILLSVLLGVAAIIRYHRLSLGVLSHDEAFSWRLSRYPVPELMRRTVQDAHPPLYYLALKAWTVVWGTSPVALRSLSVVFGAMSVGLMFLLCYEACAGRLGGDLPRRITERLSDRDPCLASHPKPKRPDVCAGCLPGWTDRLASSEGPANEGTPRTVVGCLRRGGCGVLLHVRGGHCRTPLQPLVALLCSTSSGRTGRFLDLAAEHRRDRTYVLHLGVRD